MWTRDGIRCNKTPKCMLTDAPRRELPSKPTWLFFSKQFVHGADAFIRKINSALKLLGKIYTSSPAEPLSCRLISVLRSFGAYLYISMDGLWPFMFRGCVMADFWTAHGHLPSLFIQGL